MIRILVVNHEPLSQRRLHAELSAATYVVIGAVDGESALPAAAIWRPDLILLDLPLPDIGDVDIIRRLRATAPAPIIVLSDGTTSDMIAMLDAGAGDLVTKPFGLAELLARIRAITRRSVPIPEPPLLRIGQHTIDLDARLIIDARSRQVRLTSTEWAVLDVLARHRNQLVSHHELRRQVWKSAAPSASHGPRQYIARLRRKLETDTAHPRHLLTEAGLGYRLLPGPGKSEDRPRRAYDGDEPKGAIELADQVG